MFIYTYIKIKTLKEIHDLYYFTLIKIMLALKSLTIIM